MDDSVKQDTKYTTFEDTYKIISFALGLSMMYPSPRTEKRRIICILLMVVITSPLTIMILIDIYFSWKQRDIDNIIRHSTIIGPFSAGLCKMFLLFFKRRSAQLIVEEFDRDYCSYNVLPRGYKLIIDRSIRNNISYSERAWTVVVSVAIMTFPVMAITLNIYSHLFESEPTKYMIHDLVIPFTEPERRFETPIYEFFFVYMFCACVLLIMTFVGYDAFFGLSVNHACLKMELYCKAVEDALKEGSEDEMHGKIVRAILEQNKLKRFVALIQDTFNVWLGLILFATLIQIGSCLYHITEGHGVDIRYISCVVGTVIQFYLPCRYSSKVKHMSVETATLIYSAGWEDVPYNKIRKTLLFMIARNQNPYFVTAFNFFTFDMDLFVRILNSSYSMYTLMRS